MSTIEIETLILRFRDLVTAPGGTIQEHQNIAENGFVWWGWWKKSDEKIPYDLFYMLKEKSKSSFDVFLFDSGRSKIYKASCTGIEFGSSPIPSPNSENTPDYYKTKSYLAWFRFSKIEASSCEELILQKYSYRKEDSFFENGVSKFTNFYNKTIFSCEELKQQDRTIWFISPKKSSDHSHEILLLSSNKISPENFPRKFIQTDHKSLLWVSDCHFSPSEHRFPLEPTAQRKTLAVTLDNAITTHNEKVSGLIISGDLTWKATPEEYGYASKFIDFIKSSQSIDNYNCILCPGNHDLSYVDDEPTKGTEISVTPEKAMASFKGLYESLYYLQPNDYLCSGRRLLLGGVVPVEIVSINSSRLAQHKESFRGHGFISDDQLSHITTEMGWNKSVVEKEKNGPYPFRIAVLHHHILPVTLREHAESGQSYSVLLDAKALAKWVVENGIQLVLHGHMHQPHFSQFSQAPDVVSITEGDLKSFYIAGLGSTGVEQTHLGDVGKNTFGVISFENAYVKIKIYSIDPGQKSELLHEYSFRRKE